MSDFQAALPKVIKWSVGDNQYDTEGKNPKRLTLGIPVESVPAFCNHLMALADDEANHKTIKVWDYQAREQVEVSGITINAKGREGSYGPYGNINPAQTTASQQAPF